MSRIGTIALAATVAVGLLFACGDKNAPLSPSGEPAGDDSGAGGSSGGGDGGDIKPSGGVSFSADIMPLLTKSCSCHVTGSIPPALNNYASVKASAEVSATAIAEGSMPIAAPLSPAEQALFQSWLKAGMPNN
jgi:hypothetical protein